MRTDMPTIGVAVIGAGMAGRAHAAAYRSATTVFSLDRPEVRLVAIADVDPGLAEDTRRRYGFDRAEADWRAVAAAPDIDAVSVAVGHHLHREIVETLLAAGKHVLCEKPLALSPADGRAMAAAAARAGTVAAVGYTYRCSPALAAIRREVASGRLGTPVHVSGHVWHDYALDPLTPMSWRYRGAPGSGVLADTGTHLIDAAEYVCGPIRRVSGARLTTVIHQRPVPAGPTVGHNRTEVTGEYARVENEDIAGFTALFANGAIGTFSASRVAHGQPDGLGFTIFCTAGSAAFDLQRASEFTISDSTPPAGINGPRRVYAGPEHPYVRQGLSVDAPGAGHGTGDMFTFQARAFLDQIAGIDVLPRCASIAEAVRPVEIVAAIVASAEADGASVAVDSPVPSHEGAA